MVTAYRSLSSTLLRGAGAKLAAEVSKGKEAEAAWNDNLLELVALSRVATYHYWLSTFLAGVEAVQDSGLRSALLPLVSLLAVHSLVRDAALFLEHHALSPEHLPPLRAKGAYSLPYFVRCSDHSYLCSD